MSQLRIFRGMEIISRFLTYHIYINHQNVALLKTGDQITLNLAPGTHDFQIKTGVFTSQVYRFSIAHNQTILLEIKLSSVMEKLILILFSTLLLHQLFDTSFNYSYEISMFCLLSLFLVILFSFFYYKKKIIWIYRIEME